MQSRPLPEFRTHGGDAKFIPLGVESLKPSGNLRRHIRFLEEWLQRPLRDLTVLDVGCGRGELVAALRGSGVRAFGYDVDERFVESGRVLNTMFPDEYPVLSTLDSARTIFPDRFFDLVISDQVLEHVAALPQLAMEVSRVLKPGGYMAHQFPSRFRPVEPHYFLPFVHWFPKSSLRRGLIKAMLRLGGARQFFPQYDVDSRAAIIYRYSVEETFYRPVRELERAFAEHGIRSTMQEGMTAYVASRLSCPRILAFLLSPVAGAFRMVMLTGCKERA
jgi:SAM-dependent methyltransferase